MSDHIADLFANKQQYWTPLYQRRYVWSTPNWEALWRDLLKIQHQIDAGEDNQHFTGTIVTQPYEKSQEKYEIIDGQQRLITFQIIFCVIRDLCAAGIYPTSVTSEIESGVAGFAKLSTLQMGDTSSPYRLLITKDRDKKAFESIVNRDIGEQIKTAGARGLKEYEPSKQSDQDRMVGSVLREFQSLEAEEQLNQNRIVTAYGYFGAKIMDYLMDKGPSKLLNLTQTLSYHFHVNHAHLGSKDEAQQIFESINSTGKALDEFDLLRNDLFLRIGDRKEQEELYDKYWRDFDEKPFWEETGRVDEFLLYFLTAKLGPMDFSKKRLFHDVYKGQYYANLQSKLDPLNEKELEELVKSEFRELSRYAKSYQEMEDPTTNIGRRRQFYKDLNSIFENLDLTTLPPFMLAVKNELDLDTNELDLVYKLLESYVLRCQLAHGVNADRTTSLRINALFSCLDLFSQLIKRDNKDFEKFNLSLSKLMSSSDVPDRTWIDVDRVLAGLRKVGHQIADGEKFSVALAKLLSSDGVPGRRWLNNTQVLAGLRRVDRQIESSSSSRRQVWNMLRYIFYRIECEMRQTAMSFDEFFTWYALINPLSKFQKRTDSYSIGNIIFCEKHLPNHLPFPEKKNILLKGANASLMLNKKIEKYESTKWSSPQIRERENELLSIFHEIWPPAEYFIGGTSDSKVESPIIDKSSRFVDPQWVSMVGSDDYQPVRFIGYTSSEELSKIKVRGDKIVGVGFDNNEHLLERSNILFVCKAAAWPEVDSYVEILNFVRQKQLQPPRNESELLRVDNRNLQLALKEQVTVVPVTRYGHVLEGTIEDFDEEAIYMQIRECLVIVYRDGLYEFATNWWYEGVVIEFNGVKGYGFIRSENLPRIFVHISEVLDANVDSLELDQRVEFDINLTKRGLQAINVNLLDE